MKHKRVYHCHLGVLKAVMLPVRLSSNYSIQAQTDDTDNIKAAEA